MYLACNEKRAFSTSEQPKIYKLWSCQEVCDALHKVKMMNFHGLIMFFNSDLSDRHGNEYICLNIRDLFHVYLNKFEFHFSRLHVNKINNFCFLLNKRRVPCMTK